LFEFAVFKHPSATGLGAYQDTVGDLAMDMLGVAITAAAILALRSLRQGRASGRGGPAAMFAAALPKIAPDRRRAVILSDIAIESARDQVRYARASSSLRGATKRRSPDRHPDAPHGRGPIPAGRPWAAGGKASSPRISSRGRAPWGSCSPCPLLLGGTVEASTAPRHEMAIRIGDAWDSLGSGRAGREPAPDLSAVPGGVRGQPVLRRGNPGQVRARVRADRGRGAPRGGSLLQTASRGRDW